ncbi:hypothetical protein [Streptomyces sp. KR80]|uniref:hypothetical protein n=1 Tax=Streptomyces sp. KR80 TaxID=3457426 RepID=UPI003FD3F5EE
MKAFRTRYGGSPLSLLLLLASFALTVYAGLRLLKGDTTGVVLWFVGAAVLHDLVLLPLYSFADRGLEALFRLGSGSGKPVRTTDPGWARTQWINHVRVPVFLSGLLLLVWFPLILDRVDHYEAFTGLPGGVFWERWLLISAGLFGASALWLVVRMTVSRHRAPQPGPPRRPVQP